MNTFDYFVFVGTYTKPMWLETHETSEGIYTLEYNSSTGELKQKSSININFTIKYSDCNTLEYKI